MLVRENILCFRNENKISFPERFDNEVYHSSGRSSEKSQPVNYISNFSIKYILKGEEDYIVNGNRRKISSGNMLIVNDKSEASFKFADAEALSIFINPKIIRDCHYGLITGDTYLEDPFSNEYEFIQFYDSVQNVDDDVRSYFDQLINNNNSTLTIDFFYELANQLILSQNKLNRRINKISSKRITTRYETYRRLEIGREYIEANLHASFDLEVISQVSCLSKYHFIRLFKEVYNITPHRYYLLKKLNILHHRLSLLNSQDSINDLILSFGFSNYSVFYKQFKQIYGVAPSSIQN